MGRFRKILILFAVFAIILVPMASAEAQIVVDALGDGNAGACGAPLGDCTIRDAVTLANATPGQDTITFDGSLFPANPIVLTSSLNIQDTVIIDGGPGQTIIDANQADRVFVSTSPGGSVEFHNLSMMNGRRSGFNGGGLFLTDADFIVNNCVISGNSVVGSAGGAGIYFANFTPVASTLTVTGSEISGNDSSTIGGGIYVLNSNGTGSAVLTITDSTFSGNTAATDGGGLYNVDGTVTLEASTFSGNTASAGGGIYSDGGTVDILNTTIAGNTTTTVGEATVQGINLPFLTVENSIIANDTAGVSCGFVPASQTGNIDSGTSCGWGTNSGSQSSTDPLLGTLGDYGGATQTLPLLPGSPAIDVGTASIGAGTCTGGNDQRGVTGAVGNCDIGSFESQGFALALFSGDSQAAPVGTAFPQPLVVSVTPVPPEPVDGGIVEFRGPASGAGTTFGGFTTQMISAGAASLNVTANTIPGAYIVTADTSGGSGLSVGFNIANTAAVTTTTIDADTPDPSYPGETVTVDVTVTGLNPSGTVDITGADMNCIISLVAGTGSCDVTFTASGTRTLTATYGGDSSNAGSADTEAHEVFFPPGDSDHDGNADIFWRDAQRAITLVSYFIGTDYSGKFKMLQFAVPAPWEMAAAADFNLDGGTDILWRNPVSGINVLAHYQDNLLLNFKLIPGQGTEWRVFGTGDSNKDHYPDIFWYNTETRENEVWYMQDKTFIEAVDLPRAPAPWVPLAVADFNGDTNPDVVARSGITGRVIIAFLSATNLQGTAKLPVASTGWEACGTVDLSGDFMPDLVWRDPVTGADEVWVIENSARTSTVALPVVMPGWNCMAGHK